MHNILFYFQQYPFQQDFLALNHNQEVLINLIPRKYIFLTSLCPLKLEKDFDLVLTDDPNEVPVGKVGIILDEDNIEKIRPILELMALEKSQVLFQTPNGYVQLQVRDITYLEAYGDDIYLHGDEITNQVIKQPLYQLEEILKPYHFVRMSKSYIVNISKIRYIRSGFNAK